MAPASEPPERVSEAFERLWVCYGAYARARNAFTVRRVCVCVRRDADDDV
jgi:hypothetical protein